MLGYGIEAFYPSPQYNDFCKSGDFGRYPATAPVKTIDPLLNNCTFSKTVQEQSNVCYANQGFPVYDYNEVGCTTTLKECNYCNKQFNDTMKDHNKIVFVIALIIGILTLFIGFGVLSIEPVGSSLMASGIGAIFYGSMRNWDNLSDIWRFLLLLMTLVLLIWITLRLNKNKEEKKKRK